MTGGGSRTHEPPSFNSSTGPLKAQDKIPEGAYFEVFLKYFKVLDIVFERTLRENTSFETLPTLLKTVFETLSNVLNR